VTEHPRLRASDLEVGLPVMLVGATEGILVHGKPEARLQDGHPGRIRRWYGEDHVIVDWYGFSGDDVSEYVGFARDEEDGTYGLIPITEDEYLRRCDEAESTR
jgi:hypothetical protein